MTKASPQSVLEQVEDACAQLKRLMAKTSATKEVGLWLAAYRELLKTLELIGKARGEFGDTSAVTINVLQSQDWGQVRTVIFDELRDHPAIRASLAKRLLALGEDTLNGHTAPGSPS